MFVGIVILFVLPDFPHTWKLLTPEMKFVANRRMAIDAAEADVDIGGGMSQVRGMVLALTDPKVRLGRYIFCGYRLIASQTYLISLMYHCVTGATGFQNFFPSLTATLGFSDVISLLLVAPPYIFMVFWSYLHSSGRCQFPHTCITQTAAADQLCPLRSFGQISEPLYLLDVSYSDRDRGLLALHVHRLVRTSILQLVLIELCIHDEQHCKHWRLRIRIVILIILADLCLDRQLHSTSAGEESSGNCLHEQCWQRSFYLDSLHLLEQLGATLPARARHRHWTDGGSGYCRHSLALLLGSAEQAL